MQWGLLRVGEYIYIYMLYIFVNAFNEENGLFKVGAFTIPPIDSLIVVIRIR